MNFNKIDKIIIATGNKNKFVDFKRFLPGISLEMIKPMEEPEEIYNDYLANARLKADFYGEHCRGHVLSEDSGFEVAALGGAPGIFSARYAPTSQERIARVLREMESVTDRRARFFSAICVRLSDGQYLAATGEVWGQVPLQPRGLHGWGYEPILELPNGLTIAEHRDQDLKFQSHRRTACENLQKIFNLISLQETPRRDFEEL